MKSFMTTFSCLLFMVLSLITRAEIYESKDADGNPVFTDNPTTDAEKIDLPQENVSDSVDTPPKSEAAKASVKPSTSKGSAGHGNVVVIPNDREEGLESELAADRPHEVLEAEKRYEVGDNPSAAELQRREEARKGEYTDEDGNTVRVEHRGHAK